MIRDPDRIDDMVDRLRAVWTRHPDLRLGQMVANGAVLLLGQPAHLCEDEELMAAIEEVHP